MTFAEDLLAWGRLHGRRDMPWQQTTNGVLNVYWVWVSEVMLQQTQVQTVQHYFLAFIQRFPSRRGLAEAALDDVLAAWSGLGYYRRARNLHTAARQLELNYSQNDWPSSRDAWQALPGLGRSTAAAIVASCFNQREAILDGNVKRVLARQVCAEQPWGSAALDRFLWDEAQARLPRQADAMPLYTQSLMDLGATVCLPRRPDCGSCPVSTHCQAFQRKASLEFPRPKPAKARPVRQARWLVIAHLDPRTGELTLGLQQQPEQGVWAGLWSFPALDPNAFMPEGWVEWERFQHDFSHFRLAVGLWMPKPLLDALGQPDSVLSAQDSGSVAFDPSPSTFKTIPDWLEQGIPSPVRQVLLRLAKSLQT